MPAVSLRLHVYGSPIRCITSFVHLYGSAYCYLYIILVNEISNYQKKFENELFEHHIIHINCLFFHSQIIVQQLF